MEFSVALTIDSYTMGDNEAKKKSLLINSFFEEVNNFIQQHNYGDDIYQYLISLYVVNPPIGYEHLHKEFKPKYTDNKLLTNNFTGEKLEITKQFHYSIKISGKLFEEFVAATDKASKKLLAAEVLKSLSNLDALPKKVKDFDKERFKVDMEQFFKKQNLI